MKPQYFEFTQTADSVIRDGTVRSRILAAAIAFAFARSALLPSSPVEVPAAHFNSQVKQQLSQALSEFNENVVFDLRSSVELLQVFWLMRYTAAHPGQIISAVSECSFFDAFTGAHLLVSSADCEFLNTYKKEILLMAAAACKVICQSQA